MQYEVMAPVGSRESLAAALKAGADSIYFGIESLNMRAHSASRFTIKDLHEIAQRCDELGVKSYLTVNTIIYGEDLALMREICDAAKEAHISAVIAADVAVLSYCRTIGQEVHLSTQLNISNEEALRFYSAFADVVVLARELKMEQVKEISDFIDRENICGPSGEKIRIEMFCHGECMQQCRRSYTVRDKETGVELDIDNEYIMSPKDLKTIGFIDKMMKAGVSVFKIEGRARSAEYVYTVVQCYKEAIRAVQEGTFNEERVKEWDERLSSVFNRGFWDGYYQGRKLGEWTEKYGSSATEKKVYVGKGMKYFSKLEVAEFLIEAGEIEVGDRLVAIGPTTGVVYLTADSIHGNDGPVEKAGKGMFVSIPSKEKIRPSDKLYKLVTNDPGL